MNASRASEGGRSGAHALPASPPPGLVGHARAWRRLLEAALAARAAEARGVPPPMIVIAGPRGSGKTTLARSLAGVLGARLLLRRVGADGRLEAVPGASDAPGGDGPPALVVVETCRTLPLAGDAFDTRGGPGPIEIRLPGYVPEERARIAEASLVPAALAATGAPPEGPHVEALVRALPALLEETASEPGVHDLERRLFDAARRIVLALSLGEEAAPPPPPRRTPGERRAEVGSALGARLGEEGVAEALIVEAARLPALAEPILATPLAAIDVAAQGPLARAVTAALTHVHDHVAELRLTECPRPDEIRVLAPRPRAEDPGALDLAIFLAVVSLASDRPLRPEVAALGALSLRGTLEPTAFLLEKALAAARAGARRVLVPEPAAEALVRELSPEARAAVEVVPTAHARDAVREALIDIVIARDLHTQRDRRAHVAGVPAALERRSP